MSKSKNESNEKVDRKIRLFESHPSENYATRIVRGFDFQENLQLVLAYQDAARRLAATFSSGAKGDLLLMPFLYLYRHAFELLLKEMLRSFVLLRVRCIDGEISDLEEVVSDEFMKSLSHRLYKIFNKVKMEYEKLQVGEPFPSTPEKLISKISEVDKNGESFRYSHQLRDEVNYIDFINLNQEFEREFNILLNLYYSIDGYFSDVPNLDENY